MGQKWATSSLGGYLASPFLSREVRVAAQPQYKFRQLCRVETQFGAHMGDTLQFLKVSNLADTGRVIGEEETVPDTSLTMTRDTITVKEYSMSVNYTGWLQDLADLSIEDIIINALKDNMAKTLDRAAGLAFRSARLIYTPTGTMANPSYTLSTTGTVTAVATRNISAWDIKNIHDLMKSTYLMPHFTNNEYVCVATTTFLRGLRDDREWIDAVHHGDPDRIFNAEVGNFDGIRFIEENHVLDNTGLSGGLGEAIFVAGDAVLEMGIYPEEIQAKIGADYGRDKGLRWVWGGGFKKVWDYSTDSEARLIRVYTA